MEQEQLELRSLILRSIVRISCCREQLINDLDKEIRELGSIQHVINELECIGLTLRVFDNDK